MVENFSCGFNPKRIQTKNQKGSIAFNKRFSTGELPVEANRYRLILGKFCPWATQVAIEIDYLGLDQVISKGVVYPLRRNGITSDWWFGDQDEIQDPVLKTKRLSQNYQKAVASFNSRASVPALIDVTTGQVVNNDLDILLDELALEWQKFANEKVKDFYPQNDQKKFRAQAVDILENVNQLPGKITAVKSQTEYERLAKIFFDHLAKYDGILQQQKYLWGNHLTQLDIRLFVTLVRFDLVYYYLNKLSYRQLTDYPALWAYAKRLYHLPAFKKNTDFNDIKLHFYQVDDQEVTSLGRILPLLNEEKWDK
ncbi:glutathione S-transferase C-terminal domain-containing protein [Liquorilactobacillus sicerae]|uniref:glutathione S-transferase C-terminal domain-containing protein n=1 Tax=Liquorilactobacillus sicerae TaxID=1416943 RepID=UPI0024811EA3|nr:glutathione S-transferase C-terminal domain-containing protein [Liquorilactobacillus sicerae]